MTRRNWQPNDRALYYGQANLSRKPVVVARAPDENGFCSIFVENSGMELVVHESELYPLRELDPDLHEMGWAELQDEVMRLRGGLRYITSQEGDDLCWMDFYKIAADLLPEKPPLDFVKTVPPKELMLHNCDKFVSALCAGRPQDYKADSSEDFMERLNRARQVQYDLGQLNLEIIERLAEVVGQDVVDKAVAHVQKNRGVG